MRAITIQNFGPIRDSKRLEIKPLSIFCGQQGSGKSTITKLISTFSWIEKALVRQQVSVNYVMAGNRFQSTYCKYHYIDHYFKADSYMKYVGEAFTIEYKNGKVNIEPKENGQYRMPKIMYVPAERNFMVAVEHAEKIAGLPPSLVTLQDEYRKALAVTESQPLPINGFSVRYDRLNKIAWLHGDGFKVRVHEAASGLQSVIPLIIVTRSLAKQVKEGTAHPLSSEEKEKLRKEVDAIYKMNVNEELRNALIHRLNQRYENVCLWNIVEEMEQNLYPASQMSVLLSLLAIFNQADGNELILTTHSPYILDYITLAAKAGMMKESFGNDEAKLSRLNNIIPLESVIYPGTYVIYQITDKGTVEPLALPSGLPEDSNYLNALLEETNSTFSDLLDLEDE